MKRVKEKEHRVNSLLEKFATFGYMIEGRDGHEYIYWGKTMADACERACRITGENDTRKNEALYVIPYDRKPGTQHIRPNWYFGRVYRLDELKER